MLQESSAARQQDSGLQQPSGPRPSPQDMLLDVPAASLAVQLSSEAAVPTARSEGAQKLENPPPEGTHRGGPMHRAPSAALQQAGQADNLPTASAHDLSNVDQHSSTSSPEKSHEATSQSSAQSVRMQQVGSRAPSAFIILPCMVACCLLRTKQCQASLGEAQRVVSRD